MVEQLNLTQFNKHFIFSLVQLVTSIWEKFGPTQLKLVVYILCQGCREIFMVVMREGGTGTEMNL